MSYIEKYKEQINNYINDDGGIHTFLFWKGRVALYAILKALGIKEGDEIILPAFTCVVVPNVIIYLGAKPIYVDIDSRTYNVNISKIEECITNKVKVILVQNTFGLSSDLDPIMEIAKKHHLWVVEDCAHGFGGSYKGKTNGTIANASIYSTQWNKPFSTGIGGIAVTKNTEIAEKLCKVESDIVNPSFKEEIVLKCLLFVKEKLLNSNTYWTGLKLYRLLSKYNMILGSSQGYELEKPIMPAGFLKGMSSTQAKRGMTELNKFDKNIAHRIKIAHFYKKLLFDLGVELPYEPEYAQHTFLKFPILVKNRGEFFNMAEKYRIELGDWFLSPIHPVKENFELWNYYWGKNPIAEKISQHIVNLPTHPGIDVEYIDKISDFLKKTKDNIYRDFRFN